MAAAAAASVSMGVMKPVLAKLTTLMGDEYNKIKGLQKQVIFLQDELSDMDALLEKMDSTDELDPQAKKWRKDIIEVSYNIEDHIDDFMHCVGQAGGDKVGILRKAREYLRTFQDRRRIADQLQEIKTRVMEASERRKRYMLDQCISVTTPIVVDPRISALYKESASLVGIDAQKDELVNWAMDEDKQLKLMAIVGFGGLGKTTLANEVYREVGEKFDCKAFVCVSQKPEIIVLLNSLLNQLAIGTFSRANQVQDHIDDLRRSLQDKRYFIVIDDLWEIRTWNTISCAFPQNSQHSRVVITTRIEDVARACCSNNGFIHTMKPLSEASSRKLFFHRIFGSEEACPAELMKASYEILKKCNGLPLAIITMASMLACQPTRLEGQWEYIQKSLATKFATNSNYEDMMYILDLSYRYLPRHLKACFLYLGSYPEDHEIGRVDLVRRWVAEGFVSNSDGQDVWDTAESHFNELVNMSMIQPTYKEYPSGVFGCKVHDMILDLIMRKCKEDNFLSLLTGGAAATLSKAQNRVIRRLTLVGLRDREKYIKVDETTGRNLSQIRSFTILGQCNWIPPLMEFKFVRVLFLEISGYDVTVDLTGINQLPQLRYASVETYSTRAVLPRQIRGLRLLQTLDLSRIFNVSILLEMVDLPCLSHLLVPRRARLHGISKLKSLRTLQGFSLPSDSLESLISLDKLTAMSDLRLSFPKECEQVPKATWMDALSTCLEKLGNLRQLYLHYGEVAWRADKLSSLSPPFHNLEQLVIGGCTFPRVPRWIGHLKNLRVLWLGVKQLLQGDVAIIGGGAPSLVTLGLRIAGILTERIVIGGSTGFQIVKYFEFNCDGVSHLTFETGAMPELRKLELVFDVEEWDKEAPNGLCHLPCLEKIVAQKACYYRAGKYWTRHGASKDLTTNEEWLLKGVFLEAVNALPTNPAFSAGSNWQCRPIEEEYLNEECWRVD
ncbi:unnamed protein product [Urochloa humidicola]